jgi:hypothetical protein
MGELPRYSTPAMRVVAVWVLILLFAIVNGALREAVLIPKLGKPVALVLSGLLLSCIILMLAVWLAHWMRLDTRSRCLYVGLLWVSLTLAFEFGFGTIRGQSLAELLEPYTFKGDNIWPVVLVVTLFAPLVGARLRNGGMTLN